MGRLHFIIIWYNNIPNNTFVKLVQRIGIIIHAGLQK